MFAVFHDVLELLSCQCFSYNRDTPYIDHIINNNGQLSSRKVTSVAIIQNYALSTGSKQSFCK